MGLTIFKRQLKEYNNYRPGLAFREKLRLCKPEYRRETKKMDKDDVKMEFFEAGLNDIILEYCHKDGKMSHPSTREEAKDWILKALKNV